MGLLGNGEGHTLLILTGEESRLVRKWLQIAASEERSKADEAEAQEAFAGFGRGVVRGTAKLQAEFDAIQKAKRKS